MTHTNIQSTFVTWYFNTFSQMSLFTDMVACVEGSKWHREANVGVHTNMVVGEFISRTGTEWTHDDLLGALVCAFHDVGKPPSKITKHSEERGEYFAFSGHELASARMWEDFVATNWTEFSLLFNLIPSDVYSVSWAIEHHRPWGLKKADKRRNLAMTAHATIGLDVFKRVLVSDNWGRIGDTQAVNQQGVTDWLREFTDFSDSLSLPMRTKGSLSTDAEAGDKPTLYITVGTSGTGKSTLFSKMADVEHYSWDALRMEFYDTDDYAEAFQASVDDSQFSQRVQVAFRDLVATGKPIFVDNTNLSAKRRRFYVDEARKQGYFVLAVVLPVARQVVMDRQTTRTDKTVPVGAVNAQYGSLQQPQLGEVDMVIVNPSNMS